MIDENKNEQPLDLSYLREMSGDSADFMIEMVETFQKQTPIYMADLENAIAAKDWKNTAECAHKMKPTFFYVGRVDVRDHFQEIERNARDMKNIEEIPNLFNVAEEFVATLYVQLEVAKAELVKEL